MVRGIEKRRIVDDKKDRENFVGRIEKSASATGAIIYAWSLLTNHAHLLLRSGPKGLLAFMMRVLTGYAIVFCSRNFGQELRLMRRPFESVFYDIQLAS